MLIFCWPTCTPSLRFISESSNVWLSDDNTVAIVAWFWSVLESLYGDGNARVTKGGVGSQLTRMTILISGISSMILGSMIETIYVAFLGAKELAVFLYVPVIMGLTSLSMGVGIDIFGDFQS